MLDLFTPTKTKKQQVYEFIQRKGRVFTHEIIAFGLSIQHNRAERDARDLAEEGKIWRVKKEVRIIIAPNSHEEMWSVYESDRFRYMCGILHNWRKQRNGENTVSKT